MENSEESCIEPYYPSIDEELVGFDDDAENITKYLISGEKDLDVVSIVGMAGLGKTALARKIYNSRSIIDHFDVRAWCSFSQTYNRRELYVDILKQMTDDHHKYVDVAHLADILQKCLCVRKYLIVLDNIWDGKAWDDIQLCAPYSGKGSRIMVTTRNEESALYMRKYSDPYLLPFLNDEKSWELLQKRVFQRGNSCPLELVNFIVTYNYPDQPEEQRLCMYIQDRTMTSDFKESDQEFIVHPKFSILDSKNPFRLLNNLRLVRVLHLLDIYLDNSLPTAFQSLAHLRYLAIFVKAFDFKWVSHLLHLQTLRVRSSYIMISPAIWKMSKLRHVDINEFPITIWEEDDTVLDNLKTIGTCSMSMADMTRKFWDKFPNLEELRLHINEFDYSSSALMNLDIILPSRLKCLSLSEIFLTDKLVSSIAELRFLETLKLSEIYFAGEKHWDLSDYTFVQLKFLKLHRVFMTEWSCTEESFPCLEYLVIKSCPKLEEIPYTFAEIQLQSIKVIDCRDSVGNSAVEIKEESELYYGNSIQVHILKKDK